MKKNNGKERKNVKLYARIGKDGSSRMGVDCQVINNITVKYRHHISRLSDMLDELHDICIFTKSNLKSEYTKLG